MNESHQSRLTAYGWNMLKFPIDNEVLEVPNDSMLRELIGIPVLDKSLIIQILYQYNLRYETAIKIKSILDRDNSDVFWQEVMQVVNEDKDIDRTRTKAYEQLYVTLSLQTHRIDRGLQRQDDKSIVVFKEFHNLSIKNIGYDLQHPLPSDLLTEKFCQEQGLDYEHFKYNESILKYFWNMLPHPFQLISLYERDSKWNNYNRNNFKKRMMNPDDKLLLPDDKKLAIHEEKRNDTEKRLTAFFPTYRMAKKYVELFSLARENNCPEFFAMWSSENDKKPSRSLSRQRRLRKEGMIERVLCQCQFCNQYGDLPRKAGKYKWHCEEPECKKQRYRNWVNDLNSKGIELENLYGTEKSQSVRSKDIGAG
jgi:hypothetical protein